MFIPIVLFAKRVAYLSLFALFLFSCAKNPVTGKKQFNLISESQEIAIGKEADPGIIQQFGLYDDPKMQAFINEKGQEMVKISHRPNLKFTFRILNSPVVNAFALPGGYVYFTRGIMASFNNEAEFAGVLGHEIGHVTARHGAQQQTQQILAQVGLMAGIIAVPQLAQFAEAAQQGIGLLMLKFGRNHESQSDQLGVQYSTKIGYNSLYMADFFKTLGRITDHAGARIPTFLSTHPNPDDRFGNVKKQSEAIQKTLDPTSLKVNRDAYLKMVDGIVYGEDPKEGYIENSIFYHPELKFQFPVPKDWQTQNSPSQFLMVEKNQKAIMLLTLSPTKDFDAAAQNAAKQFNMKINRTENKTINGLKSRQMISEVIQQQPAAQSTNQGMKKADNTNSSGNSTAAAANPKTMVLSYLIEYGGNIYELHGVALDKDFDAYISSFKNSMEGFAVLKDPAKINVKPARIALKTASKNATLGELLSGWGVKPDKQEETAILNSMMLNTQVSTGTMVKLINS